MCAAASHEQAKPTQRNATTHAAVPGVEQKQRERKAAVEYHPLSTRWVFWCMGRQLKHGATYEYSMVRIGSYGSVEELWALFNYLDINRDRIADGAELALSKDGIEPKWEDDMNKDGGDLAYAPVPFRADQAIEYWKTLVC